MPYYKPGATPASTAPWGMWCAWQLRAEPCTGAHVPCTHSCTRAHVLFLLLNIAHVKNLQ